MYTFFVSFFSFEFFNFFLVQVLMVIRLYMNFLSTLITDWDKQRISFFLYWKYCCFSFCMNLLNFRTNNIMSSCVFESFPSLSLSDRLFFFFLRVFHPQVVFLAPFYVLYYNKKPILITIGRMILLRLEVRVNEGCHSKCPLFHHMLVVVIV